VWGKAKNYRLESACSDGITLQLLGSPSMIKISYPFAEAYFVELYRAQRKSFHKFEELSVIAFFILWGGNQIFLRANISSGLLWIALALCYSLLFLTTEWRYKRSIRKSPHYGAIVTWNLSEEGFRAGDMDCTMNWSKMSKIIETKTGFIIYPKRFDNSVYYLPYSAFLSREDIETVRGYMIASKVRMRK